MKVCELVQNARKTHAQRRVSICTPPPHVREHSLNVPHGSHGPRSSFTPAIITLLSFPSSSSIGISQEKSSTYALTFTINGDVLVAAEVDRIRLSLGSCPRRQWMERHILKQCLHQYKRPYYHNIVSSSAFATTHLRVYFCESNKDESDCSN